GDRKKERERGRKQKDVYSYLNSTLTTSEVGVWVEPVCLWPGRFWTQTHYTEQMTTHTYTHMHTHAHTHTHTQDPHMHSPFTTCVKTHFQMRHSKRSRTPRYLGTKL